MPQEGLSENIFEIMTAEEREIAFGGMEKFIDKVTVGIEEELNRTLKDLLQDPGFMAYLIYADPLDMAKGLYFVAGIKCHEVMWKAAMTESDREKNMVVEGVRCMAKVYNELLQNKGVPASQTELGDLSVLTGVLGLTSANETAVIT